MSEGGPLLELKGLGFEVSGFLLMHQMRGSAFLSRSQGSSNLIGVKGKRGAEATDFRDLKEILRDVDHAAQLSHIIDAAPHGVHVVLLGRVEDIPDFVDVGLRPLGVHRALIVGTSTSQYSCFPR